MPVAVWTAFGRVPLFITIELLLGLAGAAAGGSAVWVALAGLVLLAGRDGRGLLAGALGFLPLAGLSLVQSAPKLALVAGLAASGSLCLLRRLPDRAAYLRWLAMPGLLAALMAGGFYGSPAWAALSADMAIPLAALGLAPFFAYAVVRHGPECIAVESVLGAILMAIAGLVYALMSEPGVSPALIAGAAALALLAPVHDKTFQARWLGLPGILAAAALLCLHSYAQAPWMESQFFPLVEAAVLGPFFLAVVVRGGPLFLLKELLVVLVLLACLALVSSLGSTAGSTPALAASIAALAALWMFLACARKHDPGTARVAWILVPLLSPIAVVPMTDATMYWPAAVTGVAAVALLCYQSRRRKDPVMAAIALGAGLVALLWAGAATAKPFAHGGDPARHLALLAMVIAAYGMVMGKVGRRISAATAGFVRRLETTTVFLGEAALLIGIGLRSQPGPGEAISVVLAFATLSCAAVLLAFRSNQGWPFYVAETALGMAYGYLRVRTGWLDGVSDFDSLAGCAFAFVNLGIARTLRRWRAGLGAKESQTLAFVFPLLAPLFLQIQSPVRAVGTFAAAATYAWFARQQSRPLFGWIAGLLANVGMVPLWLHYDVQSPIAFALPVGTTLALLGRVYDDRLGKHGPLVRSLASLFIFGATSYQMFQFSSPWPAMILAVLAVLAVLVGIAWRVRAYLYAGFACLVLDILTNLTRWGMQDRLRGALLGLAAGTALLVLGILVARKKAQLLERYRWVQGWAW